MKQSIQTLGVLTARKAVYEKPISQVYTLEVEGAILSDSGSNAQPTNYQYDERGSWE